MKSHGNFKSLNLQTVVTDGKLLQFDFPFEMEAVRSCQKVVKN